MVIKLYITIDKLMERMGVVCVFMSVQVSIMRLEMTDPPNSPIELFAHFEALIGKIDSEDIEDIILGDLNCNFLSASSNNNNEALLNVTDIYNLKQSIEEPTRITSTTSTLIHLIFTNYPENMACSVEYHILVSVIIVWYIHIANSLSLPFEQKGTKNISIRHFKN